MKSIFTLFLVAIAALSANAQINLGAGTYTQGFEDLFTNGTRIDFLPNWFGNQIQPTAGAPRIHRDTLYRHSGAACLAALPTATVKDTIIVTYNMAGATTATLSFWAASDTAKTATGTRGAVVYHDFSLDGGILYSTPTIVGDSLRFPHAYTAYQQYSITVTGTGGICRSRFIVSRGSGIGAAARFLMDDFTITAGPVATERATVNTRALSIVPNPNNGVFQLKLDNNSATQTADIAVFDIMGKQVFQQKAADITTFTMPNRLEKGIYNVVVRAENQVFTQRLVVSF
jgi:Secretion system C-terminal sorting domain